MNLHPRHARNTLLLTMLAVVAVSASARPVVYTLRTVADGKIGAHVFTEALVTFQMKADTANVAKQRSAFNSGFVFTNTGETTVTIVDGSQVILATFEDPLTVRYDTGAGVAGFASFVSSTYPIALNCNELEGCPNPGVLPEDLGAGTLGVLAGLSPNAFPASQETLSLPVSLAKTTLLTGPAFSCAGAYSVAGDPEFPYLGVCSPPVPPAVQPVLRTSRGPFYLADQIGGSTGNLVSVYEGWDFANYGSLLVEVQASERE